MVVLEREPRGKPRQFICLRVLRTGLLRIIVFSMIAAPSRFRLVAATGLHRGDRPYQQDQVEVIPHPRVAGCLLGVVADGMGGKSGGRKAADQVVMTARQVFDRYIPSQESSEQALRPCVVFRKVTNCFRSEWGANLYADVRSVFETARRRGIGILDAVHLTLDGIPLPVTAA